MHQELQSHSSISEGSPSLALATGAEVEQLQKLVTPVFTIKLSEVEESLPTLIESYRDALRIASRLPKIGWHRTRVYRGLKDIQSSSGRVRHRLVIRSFVLLFVEAHIRGKIANIVRLLEIEMISLSENEDGPRKKIGSWTKQLNKLRKMLPGWGRWYGLLTRAPLTSTVVPLIGAVLLPLSGVDFSGPEPFASSVTRLVQFGGLPTIVGLLKVVAVILLYVYVLFATVVVGFGFRCKRAIFDSGETAADLFEKNTFINEVEKWEGMPETSIYQKENSLFEALRFKKPAEFPLDLVVTFKPYFCLVFAIGFSVEFVQAVASWRWPSVGHIFLFLAFWYLVINQSYSAISHYRDRRTNKAV